MEWQEEVRINRKHGNRILFSKDCDVFAVLKRMLSCCDRKTVAMWGLSLAEDGVNKLEESYPQDARPRTAWIQSTRWARGEIRMPEAKRAILECHAMAKELRDPWDVALCHAIGQGCSCVHTPKHALGYPMYELTAIVEREGIEQVENRVKEYEDRLRICQMAKKKDAE